MSEEKEEKKAEELKPAKETSKRGPKAASYSPVAKCNFNILGVKIEKGFKPSEDQKKNKKFMAKLEHAVKIGIVLKG